MFKPVSVSEIYKQLTMFRCDCLVTSSSRSPLLVDNHSGVVTGRCRIDPRSFPPQCRTTRLLCIRVYDVGG